MHNLNFSISIIYAMLTISRILIVVSLIASVALEEPTFKCICTTSQPTYFCKCYNALYFPALQNESFPEILHHTGKKNENVHGVCLSFQPIAKLPNILQKFKKLRILRALKASLKSFSLQNYPTLEEVDLRYNEISSIKSSNFPHGNRIRKLDLSHNSMTFLDFDDFENLKTLKILNLSWNKITTVKNSEYHYLPKLNVLNLSGNIIKTLSKNTFYLNNNLSEINLNYNQIYQIDKEFLVSEEFGGDLMIHLEDNSCIDKIVSVGVDTGQAILSYLAQECKFNANKFRFKL